MRTTEKLSRWHTCCFSSDAPDTRMERANVKAPLAGAVTPPSGRLSFQTRILHLHLKGALTLDLKKKSSTNLCYRKGEGFLLRLPDF